MSQSIDSELTAIYDAFQLLVSFGHFCIHFDRGHTAVAEAELRPKAKTEA